MKFNINIWRKYYDRIHELGAILKSSKVDADGNPPLIDISKDEQDCMQIEINNLIKKTSFYLDASDMKPWKPLWHYNRLDQSTWLSSTKFRFSHLVKIDEAENELHKRN